MCRSAPVPPSMDEHSRQLTLNGRALMAVVIPVFAPTSTHLVRDSLVMQLGEGGGNCLSDITTSRLNIASIPSRDCAEAAETSCSGIVHACGSTSSSPAHQGAK